MTSRGYSEQLEFLKRKGGLILLRAGYQYTKKRENKNGSSVWRCVHRRSKCTGSLCLKGNRIFKETQHKCEPDEEENIIAKKLSECVKEVASSTELVSISDAYNKFTLECIAAGIHYLKLPAASYVKAALYKARQTSKYNLHTKNL